MPSRFIDKSKFLFDFFKSFSSADIFGASFLGACFFGACFFGASFFGASFFGAFFFASGCVACSTTIFSACAGWTNAVVSTTATVDTAKTDAIRSDAAALPLILGRKSKLLLLFSTSSALLLAKRASEVGAGRFLGANA